MNIQTIIDQVDEFPTLPTIYSTLIDIMSNPRSSVNDVASVIEKDQASAVKVLKAVNSSIYGLQVRVSSISQAIFHIGFNEVKNLLITLALIKMFEKTKSNNSFNVVDFWKHSIAVGVISRILGQVIGVKKLEDFFISGIVHDIGKLFFLNFFNEAYTNTIDIVFEQNLSLRQSELKLHGVSHNIVGELLAAKWKLPDPIRNAIKFHNSGAVNGKYDPLVACVHVADIVARFMKLGNPGDNIIPQPYFDVWNEMKIPNNTFVGLIPKIMSDYNQSTSILILK